jgi:hypothetical protein
MIYMLSDECSFDSFCHGCILVNDFPTKDTMTPAWNFTVAEHLLQSSELLIIIASLLSFFKWDRKQWNSGRL